MNDSMHVPWPRTQRKTRQAGVALLSVVLITALMVLSLTLFGERLQRDARRLQNTRLFTQVWWYADSAEQVMAAALRRVIAKKNINLAQPWRETRIFPVEGGSVESSLTDMRACFNINGLLSQTRPGEVDELAVEQLRALLENLALEGLKVERLLSRLTDWLDDDFELVDAEGAEDGDYLAEGAQFYPANSALVTADEMIQTSALSRTQLQQLSPYLCALPVGGRTININTLSVQQGALLAALLFNRITVDEAQQILANRPRSGFAGLNDLYALPMLRKAGFSSAQERFLGRQLQVKSDAFRATIKVDFHGLTMELNSFYAIRNKKIYRVQRMLGET